MADADIVLVQNKTARILGPTYRPNGGESPILRLLPGINRVPKKGWNQVKDTPLVRQHIDDELLIELGDRAELTAMSVTRAVSIVGDTLDKNLLRGWKKGEKRKPVLDAIGEQLDKLDGSKPDAGEDEEPETLSVASPLQPAGGVDVSTPRSRGSRGRRR